LDGWDWQGGRAFATQRERGRDLTEVAGASGPTIYIGPPGFVAEVLASPSIALSACRFGAFQTRLPLDEGTPEVAFPSADAVTEFVRRGFIGGGRGGGAAGGGGERPVSPRGPIEGAPSEGPIIEGVSPLAAYPAMYVRGRQSLEPNKKKNEPLPPDAFALSNLEQPVPDVKSRPHAVSAGAAILVGTLLDSHFKYRNESRTLRQWRRAALQLRLALRELALWDDWIDEPRFNQTPQPIVSQLAGAAARVLLQAGAQFDEHRLLALTPMLLSDSFDADELSFIRHLYRNDPSLFAEARLLTGDTPRDRYDALFTWPLPPWLIKVPDDPKTVGELLALFIASPIEFQQARPEHFDILEFSAAFLSSATTDRSSPMWREEASRPPRWAFSFNAELALLNGAS
jgi:hypothetical protein